jgi:iron complex outermembrane recepter protein
MDARRERRVHARAARGHRRLPARSSGCIAREQLSNTFALRYEVFPFISPAYDVVNLRAGVGNKRWNVNVYAENVFDEEYFSAAYEKAFFSGVQVEPSIRSFGIDFRYRLGAID